MIPENPMASELMESGSQGGKFQTCRTSDEKVNNPHGNTVDGCLEESIRFQVGIPMCTVPE